MGKWEVTTYTFQLAGQEYIVNQANLNYSLISGSLTLVSGDTSKVTFVVPKNVADDLFPVKTLVKATYGSGLNPDLKFFGTVVKKTRNVPDGTFKFEAVGVLGSYQFLPNYDNYSASANLPGIIATESQRFTNYYSPSSPYYTLNPWGELYNGHNEIPQYFGKLNMNYYDLKPTCNLARIQKSSKNAYEFLKTITKESNYCQPESMPNPRTFRWVENGETATFAMLSGDNEQSIRYDTNLISCTLEESPYYSRVYAYSSANNNLVTGEKWGNGYPNPFNYIRYALPDKADKSPYTTYEAQIAAQKKLNEFPSLIEATAFDRHIADNSVPWLDMSKYVYVVYADDEYVKAQITQITYDFVDSSKDRVKLGKIVETATDSMATVSEQIENKVSGYLPLSGGTMTGDLNFKDSSSVVNDSKQTVRGRIFGTCNIIDIESLEQGDINGDTGNNNSLAVGYVRTAYKLPIEPSTTYTFSSNLQGHQLFVFEYDSSGAYLGYNHPNDTTGTSSTFTTRSTTAFYRVQFSKNPYSTLTPSEITSLQLEEGSASPYVPYAMDNVELTERLSYKKIYFTPSNSSADGDGCWYAKKGNWVHLHLAFRMPNQFALIGIGTLPSGYRPKNYVGASGVSVNDSATVIAPIGVLISPNGTINASPSMNYNYADIEFLAEQ